MLNATLRAIRLKIVENERAQPGQPARLWRSNAITDSAPSDFVGKLHASFDNTIARVTNAFAGESKLWASAVALLLVIALQVDTFALVKAMRHRCPAASSVSSTLTRVMLGGG